MPETVTLQLLREWGVPDADGSKKSRGQVVVVGGSRRSPGGPLLSAEAALRVGAGRVGIVAPSAIVAQLGPAMPEAGIYELPIGSDPVDDDLRSALESADAVLLGPGFDDPDATRAALHAVSGPDVAGSCSTRSHSASCPPSTAISSRRADHQRQRRGGRAAARARPRRRPRRRYPRDRPPLPRRRALLWHGRHPRRSLLAGRTRRVGPGHRGQRRRVVGHDRRLRRFGMDAEQAAVWGGWTHARAGDRLQERVGIGFLARDLMPELTAVVHES